MVNVDPRERAQIRVALPKNRSDAMSEMTYLRKHRPLSAAEQGLIDQLEPAIYHKQDNELLVGQEIEWYWQIFDAIEQRLRTADMLSASIN